MLNLTTVTAVLEEEGQLNITALTPSTRGFEVSSFATVNIWLEYIKGAEDTLLVQPLFSYRKPSNVATDTLPIGLLFPFGEWSPDAGIKTYTNGQFELTGSQNAYIQLDIRGFNWLEMYWGSTGAPDGTGRIMIRATGAQV